MVESWKRHVGGKGVIVVCCDEEIDAETVEVRETGRVIAERV